MKEGTETDAASRVPNGRVPSPGVIAAGQPSGDQWARLADSGVTTVVDIRGPRESRGHDEKQMVTAAGLRYVNIPFGHGRIPAETFDRVREVMRERDDAPVVVHCASGNRVGAALLPWWILDEGMSEDAALRAALDAGLRSRALASAALAYVERHREREEAA